MPAPISIRVALLTQQISPYHAARYRVARREFTELHVLSLMNSADFDEFLCRTPNFDNAVRMFDGKAPYSRAVVTGKLWSRLHKKLDECKPEIVVVAGWSFSESLAAIAWARKNGARVALMSDSQQHDAMRSNWRETIKRRVVSACDAALVAAGPHREYACSLGIPPERVFLGYDAVDNEHFAVGADHARAEDRALRTAHGLPQRYVMASGRFVPKKNFSRLVEAFALALRTEDTGHDLLILGDGRERVNIERAARRHGIAHRVRLPGFRPYDALPMFYGLADAFAHVATTEQWGLVINEAAAAALALVVSRPCGAANALVEPGKNGYVVDPTSVQDIAAALHKVMAAPDVTRRTMGAESRRIAADWGPERYALGLRSACEAALACPPRHLGLSDRVLFRVLSRMHISRVS
jgi:glycosyltransferase involved in cell wall biosynthesis